MSVTDRITAKVPTIAIIAIIGVATMNGYYIGIKSPGFAPLWITAALLLNWAALSLASIIMKKQRDHN